MWKYPIRIAIHSFNYIPPHEDCRFVNYREIAGSSCNVDDVRRLATVLLHLNLTLWDKGYSDYTLDNENGYVFYFATFFYIYEGFKFSSQRSAEQMEIVYCNSKQRMLQTSLSIWLEPFLMHTWYFNLVVLISLPLIFVGISTYRYYNNLKVRGDVKWKYYDGSITLSLEVFATILRQSTTITNKVVLLLMTMYSLVMVTKYEFYWTSEVIVPTRFKPFRDLIQFFDNGYQVRLQGWSRNDWEKTTMLNAFELKGLSQDQFKKSVVRSHLNDDALRSGISPQDPFYGKLSNDAEWKVPEMKYRYLRGKFDCYAFPVAIQYTYLAWYVGVLQNVWRMLGRLDNGGFQVVWKTFDLLKDAREIRNMKMRHNATEVDKSNEITFHNLRYWFVVQGAAGALGFIVLLFLEPKLSRVRCKVVCYETT